MWGVVKNICRYFVLDKQPNCAISMCMCAIIIRECDKNLFSHFFLSREATEYFVFKYLGVINIK